MSRPRRRPLQRVLALAVLLTTLAAIGLAGQWREQASAMARDARSRKLSAADRVIVYEMHEQAGPRFPVGGSSVLKIITHLVLDEPERVEDYDPAHEYFYGVRAQIRSKDGELLWTRDVYTSTRQSKAELSGRVWEQENAFSLDKGVELTDDRVFRLELPPSLPPGSEIETTLLSPPESVHRFALVRAYAQSQRQDSELEFRRLALSPSEQDALVRRFTYLPWNALSSQQRTEKLRYRWDRIAALGEPNRDYVTRTIYFTGFRIPRDASEVDEGLLVTRRRPLAINVTGPSVVDVRARNAQTGVNASLGERTLFVDQLDPVGEVSTLELQATPQEPGVGRLSIPPGVFTLVLRTEGEPMDVSLAGAGPGPEPTRVQFTEADRALVRLPDGREVLAPELRRIPVVRMGDDAGEVSLSLEGPRDLLSSVVRLDVRTHARAPDGAVPPEATIRYRFEGSGGNVLARGEVRADFREAPFEQVPIAEAELAVSEPVAMRMIAPTGAAKLVVSSSDPSLVRFYGFLPQFTDSHYSPPYDDVELDDTVWRYAPVVAPTWFPRRADDERALREAGLVTVVRAQARLSPREGSPVEDQRQASGWNGPWKTLEPAGLHERQTLLEQVKGRALRKARRNWTAGTLTRVYARDGATLDFSAAGEGAGPVRVTYLLRGTVGLGGELGVKVGDNERFVRLSSARGQFEIDEPRSGTQRISFEDPPPMTVYVNRPADNKSLAVYRSRTVHRLAGEATLTVAVNKQGRGTSTVNLVAMLPDGASLDGTGAARLEVTIDEGSPSRRTGVPIQRITIPKRQVVVSQASPATAVTFKDKRTATSMHTIRVGVPLGDDVEPGRHLIRVRLVSGPPVWVRFFQAKRRALEEDEVLEWTSAGGVDFGGSP